jgi:hypothetical protein
MCHFWVVSGDHECLSPRWLPWQGCSESRPTVVHRSARGQWRGGGMQPHMSRMGVCMWAVVASAGSTCVPSRVCWVYRRGVGVG